MSASFSDNKRIAKNTMLLYIRMLLIMGVSLYTSRVILNVLGVDDYGIYHLIAGFVTLFSFISNALVSAMQRYFNVALGQRNRERYSNVFSMSINILLVFSLLIFILGETVGLWFVNEKLNISSDRIIATNWVYQFSLLTFIANTLRTPFHASVIAHERMSFFAYISIGEVLIRLGIVFLLVCFGGDRLITYGILYFISIVLINVIYMVYCHIKFDECRYLRVWNSGLFKELVSFSGWTLLGQSAVIANGQGTSIFINQFYSVAVNAAMGISNQVTSAVDQFVTNFQTAFNPQITKTYAANELDNHHKLLLRSSKFSFFLLWVLVLPIIFNIDYILELWLVEVPTYSNYFCILVLISYLFAAISSPFTTSIFAAGNIKKYQITLSIVFITGLLINYFALYHKYEPYIVSAVGILVQIAMLVIRLYYAKQYSYINISKFLSSVILPISIVACITVIIPYYTSHFVQTFWNLLLVTIVDLVSTIMAIFIVGFNREEKKAIISFIKEKIN